MMFVIYALLLLKIRTESRFIDITNDIVLPLKNNMDLFEDGNSKDKNDNRNISRLIKEGFDVIEEIKNGDKDADKASSEGRSKGINVISRDTEGTEGTDKASSSGIGKGVNVISKDTEGTDKASSEGRSKGTDTNNKSTDTNNKSTDTNNKSTGNTTNKEPSKTTNKEPSKTTNKEPSKTTNKEPSKTTKKEPSSTTNKIANEKDDAIILFSFGVKYTYLTLTAIYQLEMVKTKARVVVVVDEETYINNRDIMDLYIYVGVYDIEVIPQTFIDSIKPGYVTYNGKERDNILWKKIYAFSMTQYNSVLMLDTDTLIKYNFDEVFDLIGKDTLYVNKTTHEVSNEMMDDCITYKCNNKSEILSIAISDKDEKICFYEPLEIIHKEIDSTSSKCSANSKDKDISKGSANSKDKDISKGSVSRDKDISKGSVSRDKDISKGSVSKDKDISKDISKASTCSDKTKSKDIKERGHETSKLSKSNSPLNKTNNQADTTEEWFKKEKLTAFVKDEEKVNNKIGMNIGFALIRPNREMLQDMISLIGRMEFRTCCPVQEFLYRYFESRGSYLRLPQIYNARRLKNITNNESKIIVYNYAKIYHFVEKNKLEVLQKLNNKFSIGYSRISKKMDKEMDEWPYEGYKEVISKIRSSWLGLNNENIREF